MKKDQMELAAEERQLTGKQVGRLRKQGIIPAVLYGQHAESVPVQVKHEDISRLLRSGGRTAIVQLKIGRKKAISVAIKGLHFHPISRELLHADFYRVAAGEKLRMEVPLHFEGEAPVTRDHDVAMVRAVDHVQIECLPGDLPTAIVVDLSSLNEVGAAIRVGDLEAPPHVVILSPADEIIVSFAATKREAIEEAKAAEAQEPAQSAREQETKVA